MKDNSNKNTEHNKLLIDLGYNESFEEYRKQNNLESFSVGRIILEHKERYIVKTEKGDFEAEVIGNLRFSAQSRLDFPAVGDWVAVSEYDKQKVLIHHIYKRRNLIKRKAVGKYAEQQVIASNIDFAFIVQAVNRDFSINRIDRYLTICNESKIDPIIVISKIDLIADTELDDILGTIKNRIKNVPILTISNKTRAGIDIINQSIKHGKTYCLLGSSGVGKSTLINSISGGDLMKTDSISESTERGKHVTTHRELIVLEKGGILIDNPGMREVGITDTKQGLEQTFDVIYETGSKCRFKNCTHVHEKGCAVIKSVKNGEIDSDLYNNYVKLLKEQEHYEMTVAEKRKKGKDLAKVIKTFKKNKK